MLLLEAVIIIWSRVAKVSSKPNYLPKAPPSNAITLEVRASAHEFGLGHKHYVYNNVYSANEISRSFQKKILSSDKKKNKSQPLFVPASGDC